MPESERVTILVLDDDESLREILGIRLEASGRCIVQAMASFQELERCFHDFGNVIAAVLDINLGPANQPASMRIIGCVRVVSRGGSSF